ncbi:MAG: 30S ribosomal protein S12 methylthiotransferase RimO [Clostridia bacterium]|nr:30S ribosomal protein S12 methylthiotransferase RimO [Clostridia bacterium]MDY5264703.1 30S ribosomal protein S12 methylthiotransferase RimO [Eubacteriales bacterium]
MQEKNKKIAVIALGCDKNRVDTENMLYILDDAGYEITASEDEFDIVIINTCAFIDSAKSEAIDNILDMAKIKEQRPIKIIVSGCMGVRYAESLMEQIPEVDAVIGFRDYQEILSIIDRVEKGERFIYKEGKDLPFESRIVTTPYHYAYLKIAEGCDNKCTYCAIPSIRGKYVSRSIDSLVREANSLISGGARELILVAQDVTRYGKDLYGEYSLKTLIEELSKTDVEWIRLLYLYPELVTDDLLSLVKNNEKVCRYLDIPLQHVDSRILKLMNRRVDGDYVKRLIDKIRKVDENIAIRSTFITGFPTETDEEHKRLVNFIKEYELDFAGFFAYSKEEGTAASRIKEQIPEEVKAERLLELESAQMEVMLKKARNKVGKQMKVVYEGADYDLQEFVGRSEFNAPDIDTNVLLRSKNILEIGETYNTTIVGTNGIDLIGEVND